MFPLVAALFLFCTIVSGDPLQRFGGRHIPGGRIFGGKVADIADYPYQLYLNKYKNNYDVSCGASLISPKWALTSASCTFNSNTGNITIRAGSSFYRYGGQLVSVDKIFQHADFDYDTKANDISLLKLSSEVTATNSQIIPLATSKPKVSEIATLAGWGLTRYSDHYADSEVLLVVQVPIVDLEDCKQGYKDDYVSRITDTQFCAGILSDGGKDACTGDYGGPLVINGTQVGISAWGGGCALPGRPGVYTSVASYLDWIAETMSSEE